MCAKSRLRGTGFALKSIAPAMKTLNSINPIILPNVGSPINYDLLLDNNAKTDTPYA